MPGSSRSTPMPDFVPPMLARAGGTPFDDPAWLFELKWDGYRVQAHVADGKVRLWTRNRKDAGHYFPELARSAGWLSADEAIVDGEVIALDGEGRPSFELLQVRASGDPGGPRAPIVYQAFDFLWLDGRSLLDRPLEERKVQLQGAIAEGGMARYTSHVVGEGKAFFEAVREQGLEGLVAKRRSGPYEPGRRSGSWLKIKARREQEFVVLGWEPGQGSHADLGALLLGVHDADGGLRFAGEVGSGLDGRIRSRLLRDLAPLAVKTPPVVSPPRTPTARWVEPRIVVRVEFAAWTRDDLIRQSTFKGLEIDSDPAAVVRERVAGAQPGSGARGPDGRGRSGVRGRSGEPKVADRGTGSGASGLEAVAAASALEASEEELGALDRLGKSGRWTVGGREVHLTNLDKALFPEAGLTKRDLVRYYVTVAPVLLPYLHDRGLTLDRWPDGPGGPHFWNKEIPTYAPDWVARWRHESDDPSQSHTYVVADHVATLAFLANQAAIDLHPWTSTTRRPDRPSWALIDIDPGSLTTWEEVVAMARLYRTALGHLGLRAYPKVTGKRGVHVYLPIAPRYSFRETSDWVERLSRAVGSQVPDLISWEWTVAERGGRARLDFTQNAPNKTLAAPYAVRPTAMASVSAPIAWEELDDPALRPDRWTIVTLPERLAERGDLFAGALAFDQELPKL
ncbi:MAG TPA: DNA ligase D [Candidatus Limnocylindrales bacterium]|nr:DNA ligase D [Candidatus Limnocylindrales bacterium]